MKKINKNSLNGFLNYGIVIAAFLILQALVSGGMLSNSLQSLLVPACCYIVMAVSLNLTVGILGELSLGHAGFMGLGAFSGIVASVMLQDMIPAVPLRLAAAMVVGAVAGALGGVIVGVPVLRLQGDYLAIVTLAFGQIIKNIIMVLYVGVDKKGLHIAFSSDRLVLAEGGTTVIKGPMGATGVTKLASFTVGAYTQPNSAIEPGIADVYNRFPRLKERRRQIAGTLSGGEQQMLAIGRALMSKPKLLMLDEPSMGLAPILVEQIFDIIKELHGMGTTILLVEQNAQAALSVADRAYVLETGRISLSGTGEELMASDKVRKAYLGG